eukprot:5743179-Pleurochrysis_carterae.AAC.1
MASEAEGTYARSNALVWKGWRGSEFGAWKVLGQSETLGAEECTSRPEAFPAVAGHGSARVRARSLSLPDCLSRRIARCVRATEHRRVRSGRRSHAGLRRDTERQALQRRRALFRPTGGGGMQEGFSDEFVRSSKANDTVTCETSKVPLSVE